MPFGSTPARTVGSGCSESASAGAAAAGAEAVEAGWATAASGARRRRTSAVRTNAARRSIIGDDGIGTSGKDGRMWSARGGGPRTSAARSCMPRLGPIGGLAPLAGEELAQDGPTGLGEQPRGDLDPMVESGLADDVQHR